MSLGFRMAAGVLVWTSLALAQTADTDGRNFYLEDPAKIKTEEACRQCHASEFEVWRKTPHAHGFKTLHPKEAAEAISEKMGFKLIKRDSLCLTCHYTPVYKNKSLRASAGVSCESCHGAGADWIDVHSSYGAGVKTFSEETPEHRAMRIEESRKLGMRRPSDLYLLAARCFECHTVPNEDLVNVGGHGTGSADFELVAWSQGEIRHNFLNSNRTGDGTVNAERDMPYKRIMYAVGRALDIEYCVRGIAGASEQKRYFKALSRKMRSAVREVRSMTKRVELPEMEEILTTVQNVRAVPNNKAELLAAADQIGASIRRFIDQSKGRDLAALDPLLLGEAEAEPEEAPPETVAVASPDTPSDASPDETKKGLPPVKSSGSQPKKSSAAHVSGEVKTRVRPPSSHKTIGSSKCGKCHGDESNWWFEDAHYASADPFFNENRKNVQIARLYGLSTQEMLKGDQICMDCHGTVISGKEHKDVNDGVGCERCHGAADSFLEPHQEGEKSMGLQRPGYRQALTLGMVELKDLKTRAKTCTGCHYITEERLLSSGHPSGKNFDYAAGMGEDQTLGSAVKPARRVENRVCRDP